MLCDSNSVSLMSIDNNSSSEPIKKFSPAKFANNSWWEEVEEEEHNLFNQEDAINEAKQQSNKCTESADTDEKKGVPKMDPDMLTFSNKIKVNGEQSGAVVKAEQLEQQFLEEAKMTNDGINPNVSNPSKIKVECPDSKEEEKYDRLVREVKSKVPFKRRLSGDSRSNSPISFFPLENDLKDEDDAVEASPSECSSGEGGKSSHTAVVATGRGHSKRRRFNQELETCSEVLARRQKQIDYGKNTIGYDNYIKQIPRHKRTKDHPWTPPKQIKYSRRAFDGLIKIWRTKLHCFDPPNNKGTNDNDCGSSASDDDDEKQ